MTPGKAYIYAEKYGSLEETREIVCEDPEFAYEYAKNIDKCPREDTRKAACKNFKYAYLYARDIDKKPRDDTRDAACKNSEHAYFYTIVVDKEFKENTWLAVKNTEYEEKYELLLNLFSKEEIM